MRRAIRYGDAWHPIRIRERWFRDEGIPRLQALAEEEGRPMPALCPRIRLRLTETPCPDDTRVMGEGTVDQVRRDMAALEALGCTHVLLDTYHDDVEATRHVETAWCMLAAMAETVLDLDRETVR
jgi:hypothetical protein